jgi:diguanylate cyclase (GGDEF)-like protein
MKSNNNLFILIALLGLWLIVSVVGFFFWIPPDTRILALALLTFTVTLTIINLFRFSGGVAAFLSVLIYGLAQINLVGMNSSALASLGFVAVSIVIALILAEAVRREALQINKQLASSQVLIDELRQFDPITGIMRYQQAIRLFKSEIVRSQRFDKKVCIFLMQIGNMDAILNERGTQEAETIRRQVVGALVSVVRSTDIPFGGEMYGAILPETDYQGASVLLERLISAISNKLHVPVNLGLAEFPTDGVTELDLASAAEAALQVAIKTEKPIIYYEQVRQIAEGSQTG